MPKVIFNDETVEAETGETLLDVARRNSLHIGFVCGGRGLCHTCECRVQSGGESLSPPSAVELESMTESRRDEGYRLACQTSVRGSSTIKVLSSVEQMRRYTMGMFTPTEGSSSGEEFNRLTQELTNLTFGFFGKLPYITMKAIPSLQEKPLSFAELQDIFADTQRTITRTLMGTQPAEEATEPPQPAAEPKKASAPKATAEQPAAKKDDKQDEKKDDKQEKS